MRVLAKINIIISAAVGRISYFSLFLLNGIKKGDPSLRSG
jgi:hypothetical protein